MELILFTTKIYLFILKIPTYFLIHKQNSIINAENPQTAHNIAKKKVNRLRLCCFLIKLFKGIGKKENTHTQI